METNAPSKRTTVRRGKNRAVYASDAVTDVLRAGLIAHVGVETNDGPIVLPMAYGVREGHILIHGAVANAMLRAGRTLDVCVTVTIVDGLVVARTPFHNSMNYRSVVIRGTASAIDDPAEKATALRAINEHAVDTWDSARAPSESDFTKTLVLSVPLTEASAKIRGGDPVDEDKDLDGPHWAGVVPILTTWGKARPAADLRGNPAAPDTVIAIAGSNVHPISSTMER